MNLGSLPVDTFKLGSTTADKIMLGIEIVWSNISDDQALLYNAANMSQFITLNNMELSDTDTKLRSLPIDKANIIDTAIADSFDTFADVVNGNIVNVDGTNMVASGVSGRIVPPSNVSGMAYGNKSFSFLTQDNYPDAILFNDTGTTLYQRSQNNQSIFKYTLSTAFDVSTAVYDTVALDITPQTDACVSMYFSPDGLFFYVLGNADIMVFMYTMTIPFDLSTASYTSNYSLANEADITVRGIFLSNDGIYFYLSEDPSYVYQYVLSTPFDITTASFIKTLTISETTNVGEIYLNNKGDKLLVTASAGVVYQYTLSILYDISSATYDGVALDISSEESSLSTFVVNPKGNKLFIAGYTNHTIYQYSMSGSLNETVSYTVPTTQVTAGAIPAAAYINEHRALSDVVTQDAGDTDFKGLRDIQGKYEFAALGNGSSTANTLVTDVEIKDGDDMVILLDDETTYVEFVASGVTGTGPYTLDTTTQTAGEVPTRAFAVGTKAEFGITDGTYIEATGASDSYSGTTVLLNTKTYNDVIDTGSSRTLRTKVSHSNAGAKMTELTGTIQKA